MAKSRSWLGDKIRLSSMGEKAAQIPRDRKRRELVGDRGVAVQDARRAKISKLPKEVGKDVQKRMKEYRTGNVEEQQFVASGGAKKFSP